jgi:hypothetical protein
VVDLGPHPRNPTLWEAITEESSLDYHERQIGNVALALVLLWLGACAGLLCSPAWERLRPARRPPAPGSDPAGR